MGEYLESSGFGALVSTGDGSYSILFKKVPHNMDNIILRDGFIVPASSKVIRILCERACSRSNEITKWACKKKNNCRFHAHCTHFGYPKKSKGTGTRCRSSIKVGCGAEVSTVPL